MKKEGEEKDNLPSQQYENFFMNFQVNVNFKYGKCRGDACEE